MINYLEPSVIVVDDVRDEINGILEIYSSKSIGCKLFNPDLIDGDTMPEKPFSDISLVYLDLFYSDKFDAEQSCNWVRTIIPEKSFFVIVFWTKDPSKANEVLELLIKKNRTPFLYFIESKSDYLEGAKNYNFSSLVAKIQKSCSESPAIEEILLWKKSIKLSTNEVLGHLAKQPNNISEKLKKIIISHGGIAVVASDEYYKRSTLFDALDTVLTSNTKKNIQEDISDLNKSKLYDLTQPINADPDRELNSWFHFKLGSDLNVDLIFPGLVSEFKENDWKKMYSVHDDKNVSDYISKQIVDGTIISSIVMILSRPCDVAQQKFGKNIKLLSGLKIHKPQRDAKNRFIGKDKKPDSIKLYDHLYFSEVENDVTLLFDFRYSFSVPEDIFIKEFTNIKVFNKELLSELQVEYSSYSSRLGITQII
jgi:hypothetical protein